MRLSTLARTASLFFVAAACLLARNAHGVVIDAAGAPVPSATVLLKGESDSSVRSYITQKDGTFNFVGLNDDLYYSLKARVGKHETKEAQIGRFDKIGEKPIQLKFNVPASELR